MSFHMKSGRLASLAVGSSLCLAVTTGSAAAATPSGGCGTGFDLGPVTIDEAVALPRTQAAIAAGLISESDARAGYAGFDANGNGVICAQLPHGFEVSSRPFGQYFYNFVDDNAASRGG
jgi:hypothetical protein